MATGKTFFIVDDDPDDQELFIKALQQIDENCKCITAFNGQEALKKLDELDGTPPDYIFLDLNMPRMNGKECLAEIKKIEKFSQVPVIIYSTSAVSRDIQDTAGLGAVSFLQKPNRFDDLTLALTHIITGQWNGV